MYVLICHIVSFAVSLLILWQIHWNVSKIQYVTKKSLLWAKLNLLIFTSCILCWPSMLYRLKWLKCIRQHCWNFNSLFKTALERNAFHYSNKPLFICLFEVLRWQNEMQNIHLHLHLSRQQCDTLQRACRVTKFGFLQRRH